MNPTQAAPPPPEETVTPQAPTHGLLEAAIAQTTINEEERIFEFDTRRSKVLAQSGFFSDASQHAQSMAKMMICRALGVDPVLNQKEVIIVKGKVSFSAELCDHLMKLCGYTWKMIVHTDKECSIAPYFKGERITQEDGKPIVISFTFGDATKAGLTDKQGSGKDQPSMYDKYGRNMLISRCKTNMQRWYAPEATKGMTVYSVDELEEISAGDVADAQVMAEGLAAPQIRRKSEQVKEVPADAVQS